jgi:hypothetical protein
VNNNLFPGQFDTNFKQIKTMKRTITNTLILMAVILISLGFSSIDEKGIVHLKITKEENGTKSVFEKSYASMDELNADSELKNFDVLVNQWANEKGYQFVHKEHDGDHTIIVKKKSGGEEDKIIKEESVIKIETEGEGNEFTIKIDEDGNHNMVFIDEDGNKTKLSDEHIEKMIQSHMDGEGEEIHKKIEVIVTDEGDGDKTVTVISDGDKDMAEIEAKVKKEIGEDGEEGIIEKKVWITKDGKKIELDGENDFQFETDGDNITIKVDDKAIDFNELAEDNNMVVVKIKKGDDGNEVNQTMNINIEEKNGEQYIEIDIKRTSDLNITISEILEDDKSLDGIDYSLKSNLKPTELKFYPNPSNGRFNLRFKLDQAKEETVKVMDILGNEVYKERIIDFNGSYDNQIDLTGKDKGIYILQIVQKKKVLTQKILIE